MYIARFLLEKKHKLLRSFLDVAIMAEMSQRAAINVTSVMTLFETKFDIQISPGTVYPVFKKLEKKGYVKKLPNEVKTLYVLTDLGKNVLISLQQNLLEVQNFVSMLLMK